jgi:xanthine dehydrogenase small subunit
MKLVSSEQIRNMSTLGGNFVNASPIGDMSIFFLGLNSTLTLVHKDGSERAIPFQKFYKNYKSVDLRKDELVKSIAFRIPTKNTHFNFEKVSKRTHLDIASVNASCSITLDKEVITAAHFAVGGVFPTPKYLSLTNEFLTGKVIDENNIKEAEKILQSEIAPISDVRGSDVYKRLLARQLFFAHFISLFPNEVQFQKLIAL